MSKWYEVDTVRYKTILVEVRDDEGEDEAYEYVSAYSEHQFDEATCKEADGKFLDLYKRTADEVIYL